MSEHLNKSSEALLSACPSTSHLRSGGVPLLTIFNHSAFPSCPGLWVILVEPDVYFTLVVPL